MTTARSSVERSCASHAGAAPLSKGAHAEHWPAGGAGGAATSSMNDAHAVTSAKSTDRNSARQAGARRASCVSSASRLPGALAPARQQTLLRV